MTTPAPQSYDAVGPVLEACDVTDAIVRAIRQENDDVVVVDRGSYLRILVAGRCSVSRAGIEAQLGRAFRIPRDLEAVMPAFKGRLELSADRATWYLQHRAEGA